MLQVVALLLLLLLRPCQKKGPVKGHMDIWTDHTTENFSAKNTYRMVGVGGGGIPASSTSPTSLLC